MVEKEDISLVGRARAISVSFINSSPQLGMWQATGTAIAQAPNLDELREPEAGGPNIKFDAHGHSTRLAMPNDHGELILMKSQTKNIGTEEVVLQDDSLSAVQHRLKHKHHGIAHMRSLHEKHKSDIKEKWSSTIVHAFKAAWVFFLTPSGFLITIYGLNIVAWGAMLFFLLLKAAPAMCHPSCNDDYSPRKIWLEICSQILNGLFCVTGFGLAPWRFRDLYWMIRCVHFRDQEAMYRLFNQNKAWFRPPHWYEDAEGVRDSIRSTTFTGKRAPPTHMWKLAFTIHMITLNTLLQAVLSFFMWHYNRFNRPTWATGTFIALGCGVSMCAGLMSWWEGRKVKKVEGPEVRVVIADL